MITALISRKGGVGKTTTSVNLAAALARQGSRVLLIDLDSQASSSLSLGVPREQLAPSAADVILGHRTAPQVVRPTRVNNLDLITASADLASLDETLGQTAGKELRLRNGLGSIPKHYQYVFIDCPASLSLVPHIALAASDGFILPVVPHYLALEGVENVLTAVERFHQRVGTRTRLLGLLLTMVDYRTKVNKDNVAQLRREYGSRIFAIEIRVNIRLAEAPSFGQTIFEYDPHCTGAASYRLLAEEFLLRVHPAASRSAAEPPTLEPPPPPPPEPPAWP